jgi:octanoyl-[GcvH]:protein N-octanoyltransferase
VILIADVEPVRDVLTDVYRALDLDWDPRTVGAVDGSVVGATVDDARAAVLRAYGQLRPLVPGELAAETIQLARSRADRHQVPA